MNGLEDFYMTKLFVDKRIEIQATAAKVWDVITNPKLNALWAVEFSSGGPKFHLDSTWEYGSPVYWRAEDGTVIVEGNVTALVPNKLLRFTVFDVRFAERPEVSEEDGITFELSEEGGITHLHILQGDFGVMTDGQKYRDLTADIWEKVLPTIKRLAESTSK
jgi:uncharacterized protein YndB with AHSA1/START domain